MLLAVGGHVIGNLDPQCMRMATGLAGGLGDSQQEMCGALSGGVLVVGRALGRASLSEGATQCAHLREEVVYEPGGPGSCAVVVERAATTLLELLAQVEQ